ncbi:glucocorticoid modulatory element-binding protein 2-like isoform X2 [Saccostrea echinata]|uniref:glucocorticoid modulatory element-binding protein 2-like isoform X2 n=1 Tax=Saccostrea echinata TaxID=191078 RepID=UPI002A82FD18|nr:glucocorticoid modulatory element-binding protein 2-like isoform X2 [Saccostrea echinata]
MAEMEPFIKTVISPKREPKMLPKLSDEKILDVSCGNLRGRLHRELFTCPGIHRECIELEDQTFVTPKKFMYMGEKARLKDWKNAVRINGIQVRKHIDAGQLTFWNHEKMCTGRCQARTATRPDSVVYNIPQPTSYQTPVTLLTTTAENGTMKIQSVASGERVPWDEDISEEQEDIKPDLAQLQLQMIENMNQAQRKIQSTLSLKTPVTYPDIQGETTDEEDRTLWKGIVELGLVDEFFREIKASLDVLKNRMVRRMVPLEDTRVISVIVKQLGLMSKMKYKLEAHQIDMEKQRIRLDREMEDLQKKVREYEQKKEVLKRKSECFTQLLDMTNKESLPETKRSRCDETASPVQLIFANAGSASNSDFEEGYNEDESISMENCDNSTEMCVMKSINGDNSTQVRVIKNVTNNGMCIEFENESHDVNEDENDTSESDKHSKVPIKADVKQATKRDSKAVKGGEHVRKTARPRRSTQNKEYVSSEAISD